MKAKEPVNRRRPGNVPGSRVDVNTYYNSRSTSASPSPFAKVQPKKVGRKLRVRAVDYLFFTGVAAFLILSLLVSSSSKVILNDTTYHQQKDYQAFINSQLGQLANRNKITFNEQNLKNSIIKAFPEVVKTSVELPILGQKPVITLAVAQPAFFISSAGSDYLLSANGVAVDLKSYYPKLTGLPTIEDQSGFQINKGRHVLSQQDINFLETLVAQLKNQHVPIKDVVLPKAPEEADLYTNDASYYTKFFMGGDSTLQTGQYLAARNNFKSQPAPSQYLDVRVAGKVFYK